MPNPVARLRNASDICEGPFASQRAASLDLAVQVATVLVEKLQWRAKHEPENSAHLLAEALTALDHAHAELAAARDELHEHADEMLATRLERELEWARYRDLFEAAPVSYIETNSYGVVIEANRSSCELLNLSAARLVGKPLAAFVAQGDRRRFRLALATLGPSVQRTSLALHLKSRGESAPFAVQVDFSTVDTRMGRAPAVRWVIIPQRGVDAVSSIESGRSHEMRLTEAVSQPVAKPRATLVRRIRRSPRRSRLSVCSR
jgi:PAS domain S-box-containing protein